MFSMQCHLARKLKTHFLAFYLERIKIFIYMRVCTYILGTARMHVLSKLDIVVLKPLMEIVKILVSVQIFYLFLKRSKGSFSLAIID